MVAERSAPLGLQKERPFRGAAVSDAPSFRGTNLRMIKIDGANENAKIAAHEGGGGVLIARVAVRSRMTLAISY